MSLFKPAKNNAAYLKAGLMGMAGSGKTYTAADIAIGLVRYMAERNLPQAKKPVLFVDSEGGSSWHIRRFEEEGIELRVAATSAFSDLAEAMNVARDEASVLIIDSITAYWVEFCESYKQAKGRRRGLEFQDWAFLKAEWKKKFTNRYLNDPVHTIMCGRMGFEYEHYTDDSGKKQIEKSGVKMKAEGELGFEPSLLIQMDAVQDLDNHGIINTARVLKDRRPDKKTLNGKSIKFPTFASFLSHIEYLNIGGEQLAFDESHTSEDMIPPDPARENYGTLKDIVLEEIEALLVAKYPSQSAGDKQAKAALILKHFKTTSWTEISKLMKLHELQANYDALHRELEGCASRYGVQEPEPQKQASAEADAEHLQDLIGGADADAPKVGTSAPAEQAQTPEANALPAADDPMELVMDLRADLDMQHNATRVNECWRRWAGKYKAASKATQLLMQNEHERALARVKRAAA